MINNKYKVIALILACAALLFFLIGVIWFGSSVGTVDSESVKITSTVKEIEVGWDYQLEVSKSIDANHHLEYISSNTDVITISETGNMNAKAIGEATITVQIKEKKKIKDTITIKVVEHEKKLVLSEKSIFLTPNESRKIYVYNTNPEGYLLWESSDEVIATVNDGVIKALNYGEAEIKVTNEEETTAIIKVKVLSPEEEETIELQNISFYEENVGLDVGEKLKLTIIFEPRDVTDKTLVWTSSNPEAVTVSDDGEITAVGDGNATITAKASNGLMAKCETKSTTNIIPATGVSLDSTDIKMYVGDAYTLKATITPNNTTSKNITWTSSNTSVATVNRGIVIGLKEGTTTITAKTHNGKTATAKVTVMKKVIEPYSVSIDKQSATISVGGRVTLLASITPYNATNKTITWSSSDNSIATVNNGTITGVKAGTVNITAKTSNGKTATTKVTVSKEAINVTSITLNETNLTLGAGSTSTLKVTYSPSNATNQSVTWSSSNTSVATVSNAGVVKGIKGGKATIIAKTSNGVTATCNVEVTKSNDVIKIYARTSSYSGNQISATISANSPIKSITYYSNANCTTKTNISNANTEGGPPKEPGTYYVIVETSGNANYNPTTSSCTLAVTINKKKAIITCANKTYNGRQQIIATCTGGTLSNAQQTNVGSYQIACIGNGSYTDATPKTCSITKRKISSAEITGLSNVTYEGHAVVQDPIVKITMDGETRTLVKDVDYTYRTINNNGPGRATVTITGKGNYTDTKQAYFDILKTPAEVTCNNKVYNGQGQAIATCTAGSPTYKKNGVSVSSPKDVGDYTTGCTPDSNHSAPDTKTCKITVFTINNDNISVDPIPSKTYTGSPITDISLNVKVKINGNTISMKNGTDYTYTISDNKNVGHAIVKITGKGNYTGTFNTSFEITKAQAVITCKNNLKYTGNSQLIATSTGCNSISGAYQTNAGSYSVSCEGDGNHYNANPQTCTIAPVVDTPVITYRVRDYSGLAQVADVHANTCNGSTCTIYYYLNSSCNGSTVIPKDAGKTYWAIATSPGSQSTPKNYLSGTSACTKAITIN